VVEKKVPTGVAPGSFARSYARVARSNSTPLSEERASATRLGSRQFRAEVTTFTPFAFEPPSKSFLDELVVQYEAITGARVRTPRKRNLLAACYRVHGPDFLSFVADYCRVERSEQNLLAVLRRSAPRTAARSSDADDVASVSGAHVQAAGHAGPPCPVEDSLPNLIHCAAHRPAFDATSTRRYDRRPSDPDRAPGRPAWRDASTAGDGSR
jgi:hypothetical protein